ncbi:MAG: hypothetical protein LBC27_02090 [Spirochaetaceae bacterium]|jgi:hypothetical protein|nr:hypothetical protein [Spirochaetaceae bacterium]
MTDRLVVYYKNALKTAVNIEASPLAEGIDPADLYHPFLSRRVYFTSPDVLISVAWGAENFIDSVCLVDCAFTQARITVKRQGAAVFDGWMYPQGKNSAFTLPEITPCDELTAEIHGATAVSVSWMFAGLRTLFPRFQVKPKTVFEVTGSAERTENGQVYGLKRPILETLEVSFARIDIRTRREMIGYIEAVQFVEPHLIEAYNTEIWPLLYGVLTGAGDFQKRSDAGFYFDTTMAWQEAR